MRIDFITIVLNKDNKDFDALRQHGDSGCFTFERNRMFDTFHIAGTIPEEREGLKMSATGSVSWRVKLYEGLLASQWTLKSFVEM